MEGDFFKWVISRTGAPIWVGEESMDGCMEVDLRIKIESLGVGGEDKEVGS